MRQHRVAPIVFAGIVASAAVGLAIVVGSDRIEAAHWAARWTARVAFLLFLPVYTASSLVRLFPGAPTKALLRDRRYWGLGFALAHFIHLAALISFLRLSGLPAKTITLIGVAGAMSCCWRWY